MKFHAGLARAACAPSEFRLLNGAQPVMIGDGSDDDNVKFRILSSIFESSPGGGTPLCKHIQDVVAKIRPLEGALRSAGQKAW